MNILFSGDRNIEDGLALSVLSLVKHASEPLKIYVLTAKVPGVCKGIRKAHIRMLNDAIKEGKHKIELIDISETVNKMYPKKNSRTVFTVGCMFRLYADLVPELPDKLLYLDTDVLAYRDYSELYETDIEGYEFAGVLDNYGSHFFHQDSLLVKDYVNSGVLLLNMKEIRKTKLFTNARKYCMNHKMFMPDQSSLNRYVRKRKFLPRKFNEQKEMRPDTILRHFTTRVIFWPYLHKQTIKPWNEKKMHKILKCYEFDDILEQYEEIKER
ncbi:MAG: glycosyltransferase family 8 protein [Candidatus Saccharibacteria bacterium]|nr:glycosyltransferase family 8 protein [Candidatus Saccharibacteria bacterium]